MRLVPKNPVVVAVVLVVDRVADEDFLAGGQGAEDVGATSCFAFVDRRRNLSVWSKI